MINIEHAVQDCELDVGAFTNSSGTFKGTSLCLEELLIAPINIHLRPYETVTPSTPIFRTPLYLVLRNTPV